MSACCFFGHRDCPSYVKPKLREALVSLIEQFGVTMFYVGQQGAFDVMVRSILKELVPVCQPRATSRIIIMEKPMANIMVPTWECSPSLISGMSSSTTTYSMAPAAKLRV